MTDFEQVALLVFKMVYPDIEQRGCLFHMGQCIWKKTQSNQELRQRYTSDPEFALSIRQILSVAFVPTSDVVIAFDDLMKSTVCTDNEEISSTTSNTTGSVDRQEEVDEVLHCSLMHFGTVLTLFYMIY